MCKKDKRPRNSHKKSSYQKKFKNLVSITKSYASVSQLSNCKLIWTHCNQIISLKSQNTSIVFKKGQSRQLLLVNQAKGDKKKFCEI